MGVLKDVVDKFDSSAQQSAEITDTLNLVVELTESKAEKYERLIKESLESGKVIGNNDLYFPISHVQEQRTEYRCLVANEPSNVPKAIFDSIAGMIKEGSAEKIITGVAQIVDSALEPLLGNASGTEQYCSTISTFTEGTGMMVNIVRLDCIIWARSITAKSIKEKITNTLACVAFKSVVDVSKITFDDFRAVYGPVLEASGETDVFAMLEKAKKIYDMLGGGSRVIPANGDLPKPTGSLSPADLIYRSAPVKVTDTQF